MLRLVLESSRTVDVTKRTAVRDGEQLSDDVVDAGGPLAETKPPKCHRRVSELTMTNCSDWWLHSWSHSNRPQLLTNSNVQSAGRRLQRQHSQRHARKSTSPSRHYCLAVSVVDEVL